MCDDLARATEAQDGKKKALRSWCENDQVTFLDLLGALEQCKDITTEYGLNLSAHENWRIEDPHKKTAEPDRHDYPIAEEQEIEIPLGPDWHKLFRWLLSQRALFLPYHTVYLVTDNRDLQSDEVQTTPGLVHWPKVAAWWQERIRYVGPYGELTTVVFVHISADTGLDRVHPTWAGTYVLNACVFHFRPSILASSTVTACQLPYLKSRNYGGLVLTPHNQSS